MLKTLKLRGFYNHKKLNINFNRITTITGDNDAGKTSIIQAIKWITKNEPTGTHYINWSAQLAKVKGTFENGSIIRIRGKSKNEYRIDNKTFTAFGTDVPNPVKNIANISDINFQGQHEQPFWFSETAGQVSKKFNEIVNLNIIDHAQTTANAKLRKAKSNNEVLQEQKEEADKQCKELQFVKKADKELQEIEKLNSNIEETDNRINNLQTSIKNIKFYQKLIKKLKQISKQGDDCLNKYANWMETENQHEKLNDIITNYKRYNKILENKPSFKEWEVIEDEKNTLNTLHQKVISFENLIQTAKRKSKEYKEAQITQKKLQNKLNKMNKERCPLCGRK